MHPRGRRGVQGQLTRARHVAQATGLNTCTHRTRNQCAADWSSLPGVGATGVGRTSVLGHPSRWQEEPLKRTPTAPAVRYVSSQERTPCTC